MNINASRAPATRPLLFKILFKLTSKGTLKLRIIDPLWSGQLDTPHKEPVMLETFLYHETIVHTAVLWLYCLNHWHLFVLNSMILFGERWLRYFESTHPVFHLRVTEDRSTEAIQLRSKFVKKSLLWRIYLLLWIVSPINQVVFNTYQIADNCNDVTTSRHLKSSATWLFVQRIRFVDSDQKHMHRTVHSEDTEDLTQRTYSAETFSNHTDIMIKSFATEILSADAKNLPQSVIW